jgi:D-citramalate synthase
LPDTLVLNSQTFAFISEITSKYPNILDFHAHNDYDLSIANVMEAIKAGIKGLHVTVNGMGNELERTA